MSVFTKALARVRRDEDGQSMIEYALLAFLIAIAAVVLLSVLGVDIAEVFDSVENNIGDDTAADDGTTPTGDDDADEATEPGGGGS
jgi:Flp pilus assembly pilin Flp